jgi:hypothetical protein
MFLGRPAPSLALKYLKTATYQRSCFMGEDDPVNIAKSSCSIGLGEPPISCDNRNHRKRGFSKGIEGLLAAIVISAQQIISFRFICFRSQYAPLVPIDILHSNLAEGSSYFLKAAESLLISIFPSFL